MPTKTVQPRPVGPVRLFHPPTRPACGGPEIWLPPEPEGWVVEPKYNGHRVVVDCENGGRLKNRHLEGYTFGFPPDGNTLVNQCRRKHIAFLDLEHMGSHRNKNHRNVGVIFDIYGVQSNTLERRQVLLQLGYPVHDPFSEDTLLDDPTSRFYIVPQYPASCADELFHALQLLPGEVFEGVVLKQIDNPYRTNRWIKFRFDQYASSTR